MELKTVAYIKSDFPEKFGIPRQSGLTELEAVIRLCEPYNHPSALAGIEEFSHLWLIWGFSKNRKTPYSPTVRPPRLGGNKRVGVFASRSPYRPNPLGLSCVRLVKVIKSGKGAPCLVVSGADLLDGTPIYDIKPYLPYADMKADAVGGFSERVLDYRLKVDISPELEALVPEKKREALREILSEDPRPSYQNDSERIYGMSFSELEIKFSVKDGTLTVTHIERQNND